MVVGTAWRASFRRSSFITAQWGSNSLLLVDQVDFHLLEKDLQHDTEDKRRNRVGQLDNWPRAGLSMHAFKVLARRPRVYDLLALSLGTEFAELRSDKICYVVKVDSVIQ